VEGHPYDVIVVGGGAAGLSAALVLGRARRSVAVVDAGEPRNAPAAHMNGFLSSDGKAPSRFLAEGRREVMGYGVDVVEGFVSSIQPGFTARLASGRAIEARRVLLASGVGDETPGHPRGPGAMGSRSVALPVLPRVGGS
jgi:thioredoxin reductase